MPFQKGNQLGSRTGPPPGTKPPSPLLADMRRVYRGEAAKPGEGPGVQALREKLQRDPDGFLEELSKQEKVQFLRNKNVGAGKEPLEGPTRGEGEGVAGTPPFEEAVLLTIEEMLGPDWERRVFEKWRAKYEGEAAAEKAS